MEGGTLIQILNHTQAGSKIQDSRCSEKPFLGTLNLGSGLILTLFHLRRNTPSGKVTPLLGQGCPPGDSIMALAMGQVGSGAFGSEWELKVETLRLYTFTCLNRRRSERSGQQMSTQPPAPRTSNTLSPTRTPKDSSFINTMPLPKSETKSCMNRPHGPSRPSRMITQLSTLPALPAGTPALGP